MTNTFNFYRNFSSLLELTPEPKKLRRMKHTIDLKYDFRSGDVSSAWAEVACTIGESFSNLVDDESSKNRIAFASLNSYLCQYKDEFDISKSISLDDLLEEIDSENDISCNHRKLNLRHGLLHETK